MRILPKWRSVCIMSVAAPRKSNFMAFRKETGGSSTVGRAPRPPPPNKGSASALIRPSSSGAATTGVATAGQPTTPIVFLEQSSKAATTSALPLERKTKAHKEGDKSSSKKNRKKGSSTRPLLGEHFSTEFNVSHKTNFHMSSLQRTLVEPLSEGKVTNATLELTTRVSMMAWYLRDFVD
ncbi:uncharacterized protein LOC128194072 [Vigna angularis]|uniref:uncharacterized protein LOC128194072 n=1 Tax=Phaseolus angularis TaxID=3914 RepID=UPI0022B52CCB|nr:uncharacterized protein LOC128194072 [Vigna angularis]